MKTLRILSRPIQREVDKSPEPNICKRAWASVKNTIRQLYHIHSYTVFIYVYTVFIYVETCWNLHLHYEQSLPEIQTAGSQEEMLPPGEIQQNINNIHTSNFMTTTYNNRGVTVTYDFNQVNNPWLVSEICGLRGSHLQGLSKVLQEYHLAILGHPSEPWSEDAIEAAQIQRVDFLQLKLWAYHSITQINIAWIPSFLEHDQTWSNHIRPIPGISMHLFSRCSQGPSRFSTCCVQRSCESPSLRTSNYWPIWLNRP